ncbi:MAG: response regulator [Anaerolineales bacterium]
MARILIVDDDQGATSLLEKLMIAEGHEPKSVNQSSKAIEVASQMSPDLIMLDLMMPEPTGFQLCRMLREKSEFVYTPVLIVTALDDSDSQVVAFGAGANDYITKPFRVDELIQKIRVLLSPASGIIRRV